MSISSLVTVVFISGLIICMILYASKELASYQAENVCKEIQMEINSGTISDNHTINSTTELLQDKKLITLWIDEIVKNTLIYQVDPLNAGINKIYVQIEVNGETIFSNYDSSTKVYEFYSDTMVEKAIFDATNTRQIGSIQVRVNPEAILPIVGGILVAIIVLSIIALIVSKIISMFLTIPIINPLNQLEKKVKALAEGDNETALKTQLVLKRPLREIESLADSTNSIMRRLHTYNDVLENQKEALENQNTELEAQNEELMKTKYQIEEQQAQLIQSEKMASVGLLTAAITHEINTPIGAINSNTQISNMLLNTLINHPLVNAEKEILDSFNQLNEVNDVNLMACSRIIEIIKSLKSFSRIDQAEFQEADINEGIKSVLVLTNNLLKNRIKIHEDYGEFPLVRCFPGQLNQVFMNIIVNASQAIEGEGEIFIKTYQQEKSIFITIRDTGPGIDAKNISKVFEPGYTTKGVGIGLGIGLYLCYNIIQNHNGEIFVSSEIGEGTEFTVKIPI